MFPVFFISAPSEKVEVRMSSLFLAVVVFSNIILSINEEASAQQSRKETVKFQTPQSQNQNSFHFPSQAWAEKLLYMSECLDGWLKVQRARGQGMPRPCVEAPVAIFSEWCSGAKPEPRARFSPALRPGCTCSPSLTPLTS